MSAIAFRIDSRLGQCAGCERMPAWELLYYGAFACILIWQGLSWTVMETLLFIPVGIIKTCLKGSFLLLISLSLILRRRPFREYLLGALVGSLFLVSAFICKDRDLLFAFVLVFSGRGVSLRRLALVTLVFSMMLVAITVLSAISGVAEIRHAIDTDGRGSRSAWGFTHPNRLAFVIYFFCLSWLAVRFPRVDSRDLVVLIAPAFLIIFFFIQSRTSAFMLLVLTAMVYGFKTFGKSNAGKLISLFLLIVGGVLIMGSIYFMVYYDASNPIHLSLNKVLSGRLSLANEYYTRFPPALFGTSFENVAARNYGFDSALVVDNSYARLFILYGVVPAIMWILSFFFLCIRGIRENIVSLGFVVYGAMIIFGVSEAMTLAFTSNFALIALSSCFSARPRGVRVRKGYSR